MKSESRSVRWLALSLRLAAAEVLSIAGAFVSWRGTRGRPPFRYGLIQWATSIVEILCKRVMPLCCAALIVLNVVPERASANLTVPNLWIARFSLYKGETRCAYGAADCNRCVYNVEEQFRDLTQRDSHVEKVRKWKVGSKPDAFDEQILKHHFQSFVRAPTDAFSANPDLFATYSNYAIFASRASANTNGTIGNGSLLKQYRAAGEHPGGMQAIGHKVLIATEGTSDGAAKLEILDSDAPNVAPRVYPLPGIGAGAANVAVTKLAGGGYLLVVSRSSYHTDYRLFYTPSLVDVHLEPVLPTATSNKDTGFKDVQGNEQNGFENLSMVTECVTGKTYLIGATAPTIETLPNNPLYAGGSSWWGLYEIVSGDQVVLRYVTKNTQDMFSQNCDPRASGTAFAGRYGELGLYCHQKLYDAGLRRDIVGCALGFTFGIGFLTATFCGSAIAYDQDMMFTEFWPHSTPERPTESTVNVTVSLLPAGINMGLIEEATGSVCQGTTAKTCTWKVPMGTVLTITPFRNTGMTANAKWVKDSPSTIDGNVCSGAYADGVVAPCSLTANGPIAVGLWDYELL